MSANNLIMSKFPYAEYFPKGRIIPQRIIKGQRRFKHLIVFGSDSWVINTRDGHVVACDSRDDSCAILVKKGVGKNAVFQASPYSAGEKKTTLVCSGLLTDTEWLQEVAKAVGGAE